MSNPKEPVMKQAAALLLLAACGLASAESPQDMFALLRSLGLFTLPFPAEFGGSGSILSACLAIEEFGRASDPDELERVKAGFLGKSGSLTGLLKTLGQLTPDERKAAGARISKPRWRRARPTNPTRPTGSMAAGPD